MSSEAKGPPPPLILQLPDRVVRHMAVLLDAPAIHNWKTLVQLLPEYSYTDMLALSIEHQNGRSASMALLRDLHSRGWNVVDLARLAQKAQLGIIVDTIREGCRDIGAKLQLPKTTSPPTTRPHPSSLPKTTSPTTRPHPSSLPKTTSPPTTRPHPCSLPKSAGTCFNRPSHPPAPTPPADAHVFEKAMLRYCRIEPEEADVPETTPPRATPTETAGPVQIPYHVLEEASGNFDQLPYKEGGHKLGEGGFGEVFHCLLRLGGGAPVEAAVKVLSNKEGSSCSINKQQFHIELRALSVLSHECLLPLLGWSCDGPRPCLLYPFMPRGSLDAHLGSATTLTPPTRVQVASDVGRALEYLHGGAGQVVVHRDIKSANILLTRQWRAQLGDFGVVRFLPSAQTTMTTSVVGTLIYMAPEYTKGSITPAADIYAFGVVLFELLTGQSAQCDVDDEGTDLVTYIEDLLEEERSDVLIGQWPQKVWQGVWSLAEQCIEHNRKRRPPATQLVQKLQALLSQDKAPS